MEGGRRSSAVGHELDATDQQILTVLRHNGRTSIADIARTVNLSTAPVARRIERLERTGVIRGYVALIDDAGAGEIEAFAEIRVAGSLDTADLAQLVKRIPEVQEFFTIAGDPDAMVRIRVRDVDHLQRVVNALRRSGTVTGTKTLIAMNRWSRHDRADPPPVG